MPPDAEQPEQNAPDVESGAREGAVEAVEGSDRSPSTSGSDPGASGPVSPEVVKLRRESANYRTRLRAAESKVAEIEAERDHAAAQAGRLQRAEAERMVADRLHTPGDFWLLADLPDLLDEDGQLDGERVDAAIARVVKDRPHWARSRPRANFDGGARPLADQGSSIGAALKQAQHR